MSLADLRRRDLVAVLDASRACAEASDLADFAERVVEQLPLLIACDGVGYNEVDLTRGSAWGRLSGGRIAPPDVYEVLARFSHEHVLVNHGLHHPDDEPRSWSELAPTALRRTNLYDLALRQMGVEDQLAVVLSGGDGVLAGMIANRSRPGFTTRERAVLEVFRRQLAPLRRLVLVAPACDLAALRWDGTGPVTPWSIRLFGTFELVGTSGAMRIEGRAATLVKMVALAAGPIALERVIDTFWPDVDAATGRRRLRVVLHRVPHAPLPVVVRLGEALALGPGVEVDVKDFTRHAGEALIALRAGLPEAGALGAAALERYGGELLTEDLYEDWSAASRERLRQLRIELLDAMARRAEADGDLDAAARLLGEASDVDPLDEARLLRLGWLYLSEGRRGAALGVAARCEQTFCELGLSPSSRWLALRRAIEG
ncbi:MAG TPA: bacterial transcriptional activator domain-containing protein [Acidimicrobiales bacterium]|nr:bacterial transcriptional activator domain-containing protein [Acidimicrobiales bacterium]